MVNFDGLANDTVIATFGDMAQTGQGDTYTTPDGTTTVPFNGVFDEAWREVEFKTSRHSASFPVSTTKPAMGTQLSQFPTDTPPVAGGTVIRLFNGVSYKISDVRPDGISGWVLLILN